ncbi:PAT family beta-lactamase induction signal transducer AmpG [Acinetobacter calcoaceticus]|uniref:PAT family beta-lactamase induction signal transducer AmpG n=1 Tax=Acinetobacter calcoaceticus TaxID=471 RepID=A0A4R1XTF5_ACICA|nr:PAT family beta-lactamase induction signal transducer AmpG [Acinetobacter calcoaceticus]
MTTQTKGFISGLKAFLDRRALIMLALGFSSGIPIFLIFATLSFWLSEAGVQRSTITMFSWAGLAYAFKFIWAPLIDKLPLPFLTRQMGQRRSWLLVSQILVITAICAMSFIDPRPGLFSYGSIPNLTLMAMSAVFLGFSSATQDIIVDAYRIELSQDPNLQTVLASTYNAGYRIATIITQLGGLLFAASLGTAAGNYIYEAWQSTYLLMAALMLIGVVTTLLIHEPKIQRNTSDYRTADYLQLFGVFVISTVIFGSSFYFLGDLIALLKVQDSLLSFLLLVLRFIVSVLCAVLVVMGLIKTGLVKQKVVVDTWIAPLLDFFKRYGVKVALAILLLIGFYRISDVVAGVMANLFYLDLNFDKEEIAWFNKLFAVIFVILGGLIGGILAQKYNVLKLMLVGAVLASSTNLIFVGLVKSGPKINDVSVVVGDKTHVVQPDEVGNWNLNLPKKELQALTVAQSALTSNSSNSSNSNNSGHGSALQQIVVSAQPEGQAQALSVAVAFDSYKKSDQAQVFVQAIGGDDRLYKNQLLKDVIVRGSIVNLPQDATLQAIEVRLGKDKALTAKVDKQEWSLVIPGAQLAKQQRLDVSASYQLQQQKHVLNQQHAYQVFKDQNQPAFRLAVADIAAVDLQHADDVVLKGKVVVPYSKVWLVMGIIFDNLASGLAGAVFIAFLSSLTSISFTAMQYAIFSSLMLLFPKMIAGYSGTIVTSFGYSTFFFSTFLMGIPIFFLVIWVGRLLANRPELK